MEGRKYQTHNQHPMQRTISASVVGSSNVIKEKNRDRQSEGGGIVDALPPKHPIATTNSGPTNSAMGTKTGLRLGGLSRYLLEKAQSNDSGLDLSPGTLQTLVHPLRTSNSSSSSLHVRNLFESPASSSEESPHSVNTSQMGSSGSSNAPSTPLISRSVLTEQSHNGSETTVIEKTLTDEHSSKDINNVSSKKDLEPIYESQNKTSGNQTKESSITNKSIPPSYSHSSNLDPNPDDVTPKDRGFQVPYSYNHCPDKPRQRSSNSNNENTDPGVRGSRPHGGYHPQQDNSFPSSDIALAVPTRPASSTNGEYARKSGMQTQTPKPKSCRKTVPSSTKKSTGSGSGWKFLSQLVNDSEYLILEQLGKGGCGEVSLVMEKNTKRQLALKIVRLHGIDEAVVQECINEVEMLIDLKSTDLVVKIEDWEYDRTDRTMKILMEKGQCDLNHTIFKYNKTKKPIGLLKLKYIWESLLTIVQEIHSQGIVHADLKPANFVWFDDCLKIIDFGIASRLQSDLTSIAMPNPKGTLNFISPEIIKLDDSGRSKLSPKSDIWALGCILYLMVYGRTPFEHISHPVTKMNAIVQGEVMYPTLPAHLRESDVLSVLKLCFQADYKRRPNASELLRHPFLRS